MRKKIWISRDWSDGYFLSFAKPRINSNGFYTSTKMITLLCGDMFRKFTGLKKSDLKKEECIQVYMDINIIPVK